MSKRCRMIALFTECFRCKRAYIHNTIDEVPLLWSNHSIVPLDAEELDYQSDDDDIESLQQVLDLKEVDVLRGTLKKQLADFVAGQREIKSKQHVMDTINITPEKLAKGLVQQMKMLKEEAKIKHLLTNMNVSTDTIYNSESSDEMLDEVYPPVPRHELNETINNHNSTSEAVEVD